MPTANTEHVAEASLGAGNSKKGTVILWIR
jgi:hypothetical protein